MLDKNVCVEILGAEARWDINTKTSEVFLKVHICADGKDTYEWVLESEVPDKVPVSKAVLHGIANVDIPLAEKLSSGII